LKNANNVNKGIILSGVVLDNQNIKEVDFYGKDLFIGGGSRK
jgi:hypothetical protein